MTGCAVATGQTYVVQAITPGLDVGDEGNYSDGVALHTPSTWGDVVSTCFDDDCLPPDGSVGVDDILATITRFQGIPNAPVIWLDISSSRGTDVPNQAVDIGDILDTIAGFQGEVYPGDGPLGCP